MSAGPRARTSREGGHPPGTGVAPGATSGPAVRTSRRGGVARVRGVSAWALASAVCALAGVGVAGYLTVAHYDDAALVCGLGDCHTVQSSRYAEIAGVPIAVLGLGMYLALLGLGAARWRRPTWAGTLTAMAFALALAGALYAAFLTYVEVAVIDAICQWCVASALLTVGVLAAEGIGVARTTLAVPPDG